MTRILISGLRLLRRQRKSPRLVSILLLASTLGTAQAEINRQCLTNKDGAALVGLQLIEWIRMPPALAKSPRALPASTLSIPEIVVADEIRLSQQVFGESRYGVDQKACQFHAASRLVSSAPTSAPFESQSNKSVVAVSFATLLPPKRSLVRCVHRLNPPHEADIRIPTIISPQWVVERIHAIEINGAGAE